ncbi:MAG: hypothetical protein ABIP49_08190, partial [Lysobacterales bacterium]
THWLIHDRLGSLREVLDENGDLVNAITYDAFGNIVSETDDEWTGKFAWQGMLFGREEDIRFGKYRGTLSNGQWTSEDQLSFAAGDANLRRVVGNDGLNGTDLSGLWSWNPRKTFKNELNDLDRARWQQLYELGWRLYDKDNTGGVDFNRSDITVSIKHDEMIKLLLVLLYAYNLRWFFNGGKVLRAR